MTFKQHTFFIISLSCLFLLPAIVEARWGSLGVKRSRSRRSNWNGKSYYQIKINKIRSKRSITKDKLSESIKSKFPLIELCYQRKLRPKAWTKYKSWKKYKRRQRNPGLRLTPRTKDTFNLRVELTLNGFGRAIHTKVVGGKMPAKLQDCFRWYLQGRKYFPPEGKRTVLVQLQLGIAQRKTVKGKLRSPKSRKPRRRKRRRR